MPKTTNKPPVVTVSIVQGKGTPAQVRQFKVAFARLIASAKREADNGG